MAACICLSRGAQLSIMQLRGSTLKKSHAVFLKSLDHNRKANGILRSRKSYGHRALFKFLTSDRTSLRWNCDSLMWPRAKDFHSLCSSPASASSTSDFSFDGSVTEELPKTSLPPELKMIDDSSLKLYSGSCYLPHPDKEKTGGEDAHFIRDDHLAIGVADGVGGWVELGVNAGIYAQQLMSYSEAAIQQEPKGSIDLIRVLAKAHLSTKVRGSSTACIIVLAEQSIKAANLGDSGFMVIRDGCAVFQSPVQQHDFNFPYQLECGSNSDLPTSAEVFTFPVAAGDVIVAGTDGLFDNLYDKEIAAVVFDALHLELAPQVTAQKIAMLAQRRALNKKRHTPFSMAAKEAGFLYLGGKLDDITVVVSYVITSRSD